MVIALGIVYIMTGGALEISIKKGKYRVEIGRTGIMTVNAGSASCIEFNLVAPVNTYGMVVL
jgi:hypothetical protein